MFLNDGMGDGLRLRFQDSLGNIHGLEENSVGLPALLMLSFADLIGVLAPCLKYQECRDGKAADSTVGRG